MQLHRKLKEKHFKKASKKKRYVLDKNIIKAVIRKGKKVIDTKLTIVAGEVIVLCIKEENNESGAYDTKVPNSTP